MTTLIVVKPIVTPYSLLLKRLLHPTMSVPLDFDVIATHPKLTALTIEVCTLGASIDNPRYFIGRVENKSNNVEVYLCHANGAPALLLNIEFANRGNGEFVDGECAIKTVNGESLKERGSDRTFLSSLSVPYLVKALSSRLMSARGLHTEKVFQCIRRAFNSMHSRYDSNDSNTTSTIVPDTLLKRLLDKYLNGGVSPEMLDADDHNALSELHSNSTARLNHIEHERQTRNTNMMKPFITIIHAGDYGFGVGEARLNPATATLIDPAAIQNNTSVQFYRNTAAFAAHRPELAQELMFQLRFLKEMLSSRRTFTYGGNINYPHDIDGTYEEVMSMIPAGEWHDKDFNITAYGSSTVRAPRCILVEKP